MDKMKIIKIDPLELSSHLTWCISGSLQISLKDFSVYVDEKENTMYLNKNIKMPKKDIDRLVEIATWEDIYFTDEQFDFLDEVYKKYGESACRTITRSHDEKKKAVLKREAEELAASLAPIILEEKKKVSLNEMLVYYIRQEGGKNGARTVYNMISQDSVYTFMLGYLAGAGKISTKGILSVNFEEE